MMKKIINSVCLGILAVLAVGCTNGEDALDSDSSKKLSENMTIKVGIDIKDGDNNTRVAYDDSKIGTDSGAFTWEAGDSLVVVGYDDDNNYQGLSVFKLKSGIDSVYASFTGGRITTATKYNVYYKNSTITVNPSTGEPIVYTLTSQSQSCDGNTSHLKKNLYLATTNVTSFDNLKLTLHNCIMKLILKNIPAEVGSLKKILWENETKNGTKSIDLLLDDKSITFDKSKSEITVYISFMPDDMSRIANESIPTTGKFSVILQGDNTYKVSQTTGTMTYKADMRYGATRKSGWTKLGESVDLELPSGTKWATYNIGATSPTDAGYYYAWGETDMQIENTSASYKYAKENIGTEIQGTDYDVATAKWGSSWTMPTKKQMQELIDNCTWTWDATKKGYTVTGKNGNCIFLPAAGYRADSKTSDAGSELRYWCTESDGTTTNIQGYGFSGNSTSKTTDKQYNTYYGFTVRPVTK